MSLRHSILGLLAIEPLSGYELKKAIDSSVGHFWTADQSQVYRTLAGLVDEGLASRRTVVQDDRPNRHPHSITDSGLEELDRWLASPVPIPPSRDPFLARLFFADRLSADELRKLLDSRRQALIEVLSVLEAIPFPEPSPDIAHVLRRATRDNGIVHARAELDWLDATERQFNDFIS